ncbi:unnamed protein product [Nezara viridula]|uniref:Uncharacterized protein n=1 Tax=Nezara viridula TaxID=85310 RepID=A0A9P0H6F8_NEZVI|nr:unnamed protein product [Nezara viridula]
MRLWKWRRRGSLQLEASIKRIPPPGLEGAQPNPRRSSCKIHQRTSREDSPGVLISNYDPDSRIMRTSN